MTDDYSLSPEDAAFVDRYVAELAREEEADIERKQGQAILDMLTGGAGKQERDKQLADLFNEAWQAEVASAQADSEAEASEAGQ